MANQDFEHFLRAQDPVLDAVRSELKAGRKQSHWMWFVFPQLAGLGSSPMARRYALAGVGEAGRYLAHPTLGPRLIELTNIVNAVQNRSAHQIFGDPDELKFHASMTLFATVPSSDRCFEDALTKYFKGAPHQLTLEALSI